MGAALMLLLLDFSPDIASIGVWEVVISVLYKDLASFVRGSLHFNAAVSSLPLSLHSIITVICTER
ncbi:hypothetical protein DFO73_113160 [Cytobacillus oceanisediminis]|jgi:hypothetical protein|uniref:Uncharacterized protein n=1 Tax=Cytobacillus oceanisediminis TaxID=665099 RepID=A0A2V2ZP90_9BACI|nr:hypothetical protein DFO73_113160 [Cytobacillus oceanisediminis]